MQTLTTQPNRERLQVAQMAMDIDVSAGHLKVMDRDHLPLPTISEVGYLPVMLDNKLQFSSLF